MPAMLSVMYNNFDGGVNNSKEGHLIEDNEFQDCMNILLGTGVAFKKLEGYTLFGDDLGAGKITGMLNYVKQNGDAYFLIAEGTDWRQYNDVSEEWDSIYSSFSSGKLVCQIVYKDLAIACDGVTVTQKYNGDDPVTNLLGSPPICLAMTVHKSRAFAMGNPTYRNRVYFSALGDPETWGANDFIDIRTDDGDNLTGMHEFYNRLYQFKNKSIWKMKCIGDPLQDWEVENVNDSIGAVSHYTIIPVLNDLWFLTKDIGVQSLSTIPFRASDDVGISLLSKKIKKWIEDLTYSELSNAVACNFDGKYFISVTMDIMGRMTWIYDYMKKGWVISDMPIQSFCVIDNDLYLGRYDTTKVDKFGGIYHRENLAYDSWFLTKSYGFPDLSFKKRFRKYELFIKETGNWNVDIIIEILPSGQTLNHSIALWGEGMPLGTFMLGTDKLGAGLYAFKKEWINLRGNSISFKIGNNNKDEWYECNGLNLFLIPETRYIKTKHYKTKEGGD